MQNHFLEYLENMHLQRPGMLSETSLTEISLVLHGNPGTNPHALASINNRLSTRDIYQSNRDTMVKQLVCSVEVT